MYFTAGLAGSGEVTGFKPDGGYMDFFFASGPSGNHPRIQYNILQFSAGYMYTFRNAKTRVGIAPAFFLFNYKYGHFGKMNKSLIPGVTSTTRIPLGKEKKLFGVDLIADLNLALPSKMKKDNSTNNTAFQPGSVNMIQLNVGMAFSFRN